MRTTITLDDDVAAKLKSLTQRSGHPFRAIVNETLRRGLAQTVAKSARSPFKAKVRDLGRLGPGLSLDNIGQLLESVEGPLHR